jgi:hypothetical protein
MKRGSTWTYVLYLGRDASGKKQQKWVGGHRTKKEAEDALTEALERMRTGMWVDPGTTTFGEFLTEWLAAMESNVLDTTYRGYEQMIRNWVVPRIGDVRLVELSPMHLRSLQTELPRSGRVDGAGGLSARSVASCRRTLKKALKDAMRWGLIARNPMEAVDPPRVVDAETTIWSDVQTRRTEYLSQRAMNIADRYESATPVNAQSGLGRARQGGEHPPGLLSLDERHPEGRRARPGRPGAPARQRRGSVTDRSTSPIAVPNVTRERWLPTIGVDG